MGALSASRSARKPPPPAPIRQASPATFPRNGGRGIVGAAAEPPMITLHAFANMFPGGIGETKDIRIQWALEEMGLPYEVKALDYLGGEADSPAFSAISPFNQIPVLEHDGLIIAESCAILIHLAEVSGRLMPTDAAGRLRVIQWCFAATATVQPALSMIAMVDAGFMGKDPATRTFLVDLAERWLAGLERQLEGHDWITGDDFTIADLTLADVSARNPRDRPAGRLSQGRRLLRPRLRPSGAAAGPRTDRRTHGRAAGRYLLRRARRLLPVGEADGEGDRRASWRGGGEGCAQAAFSCRHPGARSDPGTQRRAERDPAGSTARQASPSAPLGPGLRRDDDSRKSGAQHRHRQKETEGLRPPAAAPPAARPRRPPARPRSPRARGSRSAWPPPAGRGPRRSGRAAVAAVLRVDAQTTAAHPLQRLQIGRHRRPVHGQQGRHRADGRRLGPVQAVQQRELAAGDAQRRGTPRRTAAPASAPPAGRAGTGSGRGCGSCRRRRRGLTWLQIC